jgi:hypothetical protein
VPNEEDDQHYVEDLTCEGEQVTGNAPVSHNNTGPFADSEGVDTRNTLSSDDSGGADEVQSAPSLTPVDKPHPKCYLKLGKMQRCSTTHMLSM